MLRRTRSYLVVFVVSAAVVFVVSCGGTQFPQDASTMLRGAASRSSSSLGAEIHATMNNAAGPVVRLAGFVSLRERALSLSTSSALRSNAYLPFQSRAIGGWSYVEIDSALWRPATLNKDVNWVAFQVQPATLPVPDRTLSTTFLFEFFDHLTASQIVDAKFVGPAGVRGRQVQFRLPALDVAPTTSEYSVTIGPDDRIDEIAATTVGESEPNTDLLLAWTTSLPPISAPPADEVQILTPGENLSPSTTTTTTTPAPLGLGSIDETPAVAANQALFNAERAELQTALRAPSDPKLTAFTFDAPTNTINVAFVYADPARERQPAYDARAWSVATLLADTFWSPDLVKAVQGAHIDVAWLPNLHVQVDQAQYRCATAVQIAVGAGRISQHDWVLKCAP